VSRVSSSDKTTKSNWDAIGDVMMLSSTDISTDSQPFFRRSNDDERRDANDPTIPTMASKDDTRRDGRRREQQKGIQ